MRWQLLISLVVALGVPVWVPHPVSAEPSITLSLDRASLRALAKEMSRQSGVFHGAEGKEADLQRIAIYCNNQTAADIRKAVTEAVGWEWAPSKVEGRTTYLLMKGARLRDLERSLREREIEEYLEILRATIRKAQNPTSKPKDGSILDHQAYDPTYSGLLSALGTLPPETLKQLVLGKRLSGAPAAWPSAFVARVKQWSRDAGSPPEGMLQANDVLAFSVPRDSCGRPLWVQFNHSRGKRGLAEMKLAFAEWAQDEEGRPLTPTRAELREIVMKNPGIARPLKAIPDLKWPAEPERPTYVGWQLRDLARRTDFPLIAGVYPEMERNSQPLSFERPPFDPPANSGRSLQRALRSLGEHARYHWDIRDGWVIMRYRNWYWEPLRRTPQPSKTPKPG